MTSDQVNGSATPRDAARKRASELSLKEQVALLAGADFWRTVALPERGIPSIKTTDGPNGARGELFKEGTPAALFPCGVSLAATWNTDLIEKVGQHLGDEAKARGADVLLAPTVCMHRSPLGGRNFESFSEDPYLSGKLAAAYIRGVQSKGVAATIKHFIANEQETNRNTSNSVVAERPLREIYLKPFEIAIRECSPWALMSSYNLVNGTHADMNYHTLKDILRGEWKWDGMVMSDWFGTNSAAQSIAAGCDLEMPGPTTWRDEKAIKAVEDGDLSSEDVERAAGNVLHLIERTRGFDGPAEQPERSNDNAETRQLIREAGVEGITLLKNEGNVLPIKDAKKIAVIGPNAKRAINGGGGSASLNPYYTTTPFDGISKSTEAELVYSQGCDSLKWLPLASEHCQTPSGEPGVTLEYFKGDKFEGEPVVRHNKSTDLFLPDTIPKEVLPEYSFRAKTRVLPKTTGSHSLAFSSVGPGRVFLDGHLLIDAWNWTEAGDSIFSSSETVTKTVQMEAGKPVDLLIESTNEVRPVSKLSAGGPTHFFGGCRLGYQEEIKVDLLQEAIDAAKQADVAVVVVGIDDEWESEGYDRRYMDLPKDGNQDRLITEVLKANPRTIVVNQSGSPVTMPWADDVPAIIQGWYQGQEAGNALADVLFGRQSPSGKLPTTFPRRIEDNPSYHNFPGENSEVVYGEGIFIGYRHYERVKIEPLFAFGHGLTYTTFSYGEPSISSSTLSENDSIKITVPVTNDGKVAAHEIVQAYVKDVKSTLQRPEKELQAFAKVFLEPGETKTAELWLNKHSVGYYDTSKPAWVAEKGQFDVLIGASSVDIRSSVSFSIEECFTWIF
ncbi:hypothetical protein W97_03478 [Coniosporium apollinis CBS 100218]|uniref:beta-glucosidase n=1 Tax=Coniosporium apollinis (strain CBS 100218) TaxID=1168221 RepID=R7YQR2_CONA1|nr:uncharacterized protein W97_03478 [Coniosporium apollinis CBS 100218]EON64247.1 hypothetical protein W97_03478 [Coniosporium apollinis CBS 100218]